jgi:hypothetical protein
VDETVTREAPWLPIVNWTRRDFVSARVGNYQGDSYFASLLDQMWVR